jgi:hypothetical protein
LDQTKTEATAKRFDRDATYWALATLAEAWPGLGDEAKSQNYLNQALTLDPPPPQWMIKSTQEQLKKLRDLLGDSLLKSGLNPTQTAVSGSNRGERAGSPAVVFQLIRRLAVDDFSSESTI